MSSFLFALLGCCPWEFHLSSRSSSLACCNSFSLFSIFATRPQQYGRTRRQIRFAKLHQYGVFAIEYACGWLIFLYVSEWIVRSQQGIRAVCFEPKSSQAWHAKKGFWIQGHCPEDPLNSVNMRHPLDLGNPVDAFVYLLACFLCFACFIFLAGFVNQLLFC